MKQGKVWLVRPLGKEGTRGQVPCPTKKFQWEPCGDSDLYKALFYFSKKILNRIVIEWKSN
ncbi:hypothetical protein JOC78_001355 [Bacillus ectoiniformans]|nr:hypothetical protein [Bacillus ectoiniformans]